MPGRPIPAVAVGCLAVLWTVAPISGQSPGLPVVSAQVAPETVGQLPTAGQGAEPSSDSSVESAGPEPQSAPSGPVRPDRPDEQRPIGGPASGRSSRIGLSGWVGPTWWALALVVGMIFLAAYGIKRWAPTRLGGRGGGPFRMLGRWHLSSKHYVALIGLNRRVLLIGVTGQQINLLADITDPQEVEQLLAGCPTGRSILAEGFGQALGRKSAEMAEADLADQAGLAGQGACGRAAGQIGRLIGRIRSGLSRLQAGQR